jgi:hypothetical protein
MKQVTCSDCGSARFTGFENRCYGVIVDGTNVFEDENRQCETFYDGEPFGPYVCTGCGREEPEREGFGAGLGPMGGL